MGHMNNFLQNTKHRFIFNIFNIFYYTIIYKSWERQSYFVLKAVKEATFYYYVDMNVSF